MALSPELYKRLAAKLEWAEKHIFDLQDLWTDFVEHAYKLTTEDDPNTRERIYRVVDVTPIPSYIPLTIGDAIQNLRSSLDHLVYHMVSIGPNPDEKVLAKVFFPTGDTADIFKARIRRIEEHLAPDAVKQLTDAAAYNGGPGEIFWQLNCLNNLDKHRLLLPAFSQNRFQSMSATKRAVTMRSLGMEDVDPAIAADAFLTEAARPILDLKIGDILARVPKSEVQENMKFPVEVAFGEPEVVKGKSVIHFLQHAAEASRLFGLILESRGLLG